MKLTVVGSGDAFGSGGRFNSCFHLSGLLPDSDFLIDCGASSLVALKKFNLDPKTITSVLITHLHGDHFGGLPFLLLERKYNSKSPSRTPLVLAGPAGLEQRLIALCEALYPGLYSSLETGSIEYMVFSPLVTMNLNSLLVTPYPAHHSKESEPYSLRLMKDDISLAFSGDTGWSENLIPLATGVDLFVTECSQWKQQFDMHLDYQTLKEKIKIIGPKKTLLTHMNPEMLNRIDQIDRTLFTEAYDGLILKI